MSTMSYYTVKFNQKLLYVTSISDLLPISYNGFSNLPLKTLDSALLGIRSRDLSHLTVSAKLRKDVEGEEVLMHPRPATLEMEKPLIALRKQIIQVRKMAMETGLDFSNQILSLESNYEQALEKLYMHASFTRQVNLGGFTEGLPVDPRKTDNMENSGTQELEKIEELNMMAHLDSDLNDAIIEKLEREVGHEYSEAAKALGFKDKLVILHEEFARTSHSLDQNIDPTLQDEIQKLNDEFNQNLPQAPNYAKLKFKLEMLKEICKARDIYRKDEIEEKLKEFTNQKESTDGEDQNLNKWTKF